MNLAEKHRQVALQAAQKSRFDNKHLSRGRGGNGRLENTLNNTQQPVQTSTDNKISGQAKKSQQTPKVHLCSVCNERHLDIRTAKDNFGSLQGAANEQMVKDTKNREALNNVLQ